MSCVWDKPQQFLRQLEATCESALKQWPYCLQSRVTTRNVLKNEAALAAFYGVSPLQASSGKTVRHRLNRGGDRAANNALWTIAMVRMRDDPRTRAYVARRTQEGLSSKENQRCLKRYIVREIYPLILADLTESAARC